MEKEKLSKYKVSFNYRNEGLEFTDLIKNYINNLTKNSAEYWNLQNYDLKYK